MAATPPFATDNDHLHAAWQLFDAAVTRLIGPRHDIVVDDLGNRVVTTAPSMYEEMRAELAGRQGTSFGGVARSMPACWIDGVDWFRLVDGTVAIWAPGGTGETPERLEYLLEWAWQPADYLWLRTAAEDIEGWVQEAEQLIAGRNRFEVTAPCPACGASEATHVDSAGEHVRSAALQVSMAGVSCLACGHEWGLQGVLAFAKSLGCTPLDGIDPGNAYDVR